MEKNSNFYNNSKYLLITGTKHNRVFGLSKTENNVIDPKVLTLSNDKSFMSRDAIYKIKNIESKKPTKYSSPSTKEWVNSVYTYNKNYTKNLPTARNKINKMLTGYLNLTPLVNNKKSNSRIILEKKNSLNKTLVSKAETKITNDKVDLTVYIYNRNKETIIKRLIETLGVIDQWRYWKNSIRGRRRYRKALNKRRNYLRKRLIRKLEWYWDLPLKLYKRERYVSLKTNKKPKKLLSRFKSLRNIKFNYNVRKASVNLKTSFKRLRKFKICSRVRNVYRLKKAHRRYIQRNFVTYINDLRKTKKEIITALKDEKKIEKDYMYEGEDYELITADASIYDIINKNLLVYVNEDKYLLDYLSACFLKKFRSIQYTREVIMNNNKFKNWFMLGLKKTITDLYNKKVEINIVNQKYYYLNSDIFTKALVTRVRNRNNRILVEMRKALAKVSLATFKDDNYIIRSSKQKKSSNLQKVNKVLKKNIFSSIKYKHIQGVRIEAAGRLSQRLTAARALSKLRYKGSLKNIYKTHLNNNFTILRGYVKPNVQYTNINSKTRNGAFGIKGWISSN